MALTKVQRGVLSALQAKDHLVRSQGFGLNPISFGGPRAAAVARRLKVHGLADHKEYAPGHFRYWITDAGREALAQSEG